MCFWQQSSLLHEIKGTHSTYADLHQSSSDVLINCIDICDPDAGICVWNNPEPLVSQGENNLPVWRVSGDVFEWPRQQALITSGAVSIWRSRVGAVTQVHPGGVGVGGGGRSWVEWTLWQEPEGRRPKVLIFRGLRSALWLPVEPSVCARRLSWRETTHENPWAKTTNQLVGKYVKLTMTTIDFGLN